MYPTPKAAGQLALFRRAEAPSSVHHGAPNLEGVLLVKPRFSPVEWTIWFRAMRALKHFKRFAP